MKNTTTWNYRLIRIGDTVGVHEVYYEGKKPIMYTQNPITISWDDDDDSADLNSLLNMIKTAGTLPTMIPQDFPTPP